MQVSTSLTRQGSLIPYSNWEAGRRLYYPYVTTERIDFGLRRLEPGSKITHQSQAEGQRTGSGTPEHAPSAFAILEILLNSTNRTKYTKNCLDGFTSEAYKEA